MNRESSSTPPGPVTLRRGARARSNARRRATSKLIARHQVEWQMLLAAELDRAFDLYPPDLADHRPPDGF